MLSEDLQNIEMTSDDFGEVTDDRSLWKSYYRSVTTTRGRNALTCRIASRIFSSTVTVKADGSRSAEIFKLLDSHCSIAGLQKNSNSGECSFKAPRKSRKINEDTCGGTCPSVWQVASLSVFRQIPQCNCFIYVFLRSFFPTGYRQQMFCLVMYLASRPPVRICLSSVRRYITSSALW